MNCEASANARQRCQVSKRTRPETAYGVYSKTVINRSSLNAVIDSKTEGIINGTKKA